MIEYLYDIEQGSELWLKTKLGIISSSTIRNILTPKKLELSESSTAEEYILNLAAQRIYGFVDDNFQSFDMIRGHEDEETARNIYSKNIEEVKQCGFITNDKLGFIVGYSPDGLVNDDGLIEAKSRLQKIQMKLLISQKVTDSDVLQCQFGLFVSERKWIDHISYSNGIHMIVTRIYPDVRYQEAIKEACIVCEAKIRLAIETHKENLLNGKVKYIATERKKINNGEIN